eukprot:859440-Amphidinium_carterae.1
MTAMRPVLVLSFMKAHYTQPDLLEGRLLMRCWANLGTNGHAAKEPLEYWFRWEIGTRVVHHLRSFGLVSARNFVNVPVQVQAPEPIREPPRGP